MKALNLRLMILTLALAFTQSIFANVTQQETFLSNHFTDVMRSYDSRGVVRVDIEVRDQNVSLPGTNFLVNSNIIEGFDKKNVKSLTVNVFSELAEVPKDFKEYIDNKTKKITSKSTVKFIQLEKQLNGLESKISNGLDKLSSKMGGNDNLTYVLLAIPLAIIMIAFFFRGQLQNATSTMGSELQNLTSALQEQGIGTSMDSVSVEGSKGDNSGQSSTVLEQSMWEMMNEDFYTGLMTDCYWCLEDEYAAFIWSKATVEMKKSLKESESLDANYIKYISNLETKDLGFAQNSYYLSPWRYSHLSNEDLGEMIKKDKRLFGFLSPMRLTKVHLSLTEKLECIKQSSAGLLTEELFESKLQNIKASVKRELESSQEFEFASFEEEDELFAMDVDFSIMKKFPSLGWILKIDKNRAIEILLGIQARELASALHTSESIKTKILSVLPEKRRELIESYSQKTTTAKNKTFTVLMDMIYVELDKKQSQNRGVKEAKSA